MEILVDSVAQSYIRSRSADSIFLEAVDRPGGI